MATEALFIAGIASFALIRFLVEPKLRDAAKTSEGGLNPGPAAIAKLAAVRFLGIFSGLTAVGAAIGKALTYWVESIDVAKLAADTTPDGLDTVVRLLEFFQAIQGVLSKVGGVTTVAPLILLGVGLLYWSIRSARSVDAAIQRQVARLREKAQAGTLESLPPDERMREVEACIAAARASNADSKSIETLYQRFLDLDLVRRVDPSLLRLAGLDAPPEPLWLRIMGFMISGTVFSGMTWVARTTVVLATISLIPASLVPAEEGISDAAAQVIRNLQDARRDITLAISDQEVNADFEKILANNDEPSEPAPDTDEEPVEPNPDTTEEESIEPDPDTASTLPDAGPVETWCNPDVQVLPESDCQTAAEFGRVFETQWASRFVARSPVFPRDGPNNQKPGSTRQAAEEDLAEARREWTRRQVLNVRGRTTPSVDIVEVAPSGDGRWERAVLDAELTARAESRPVTRFGKNAEFRFREVLKAQPGKITVAIGNEPLTPAALAGKAVSGLFSAFIDMTGVEGLLFVPEPADKALVDAAKKGWGDWIEEVLKRQSDVRYLVRATDVGAKASSVEAAKTGRVSDGVMERVLERVTDAETIRRQQDIVQAATLEFANVGRMGDMPAIALEARVAQGIDRAKVVAALRKLDSETRSVEVLASYSSIFPGIPGQKARSLQAEVSRLLAPPGAGDGGTPPGGGSPPGRGGGDAVPQWSPSIDSSIRRARSYKALRSFARVGGVLIGRPPEDDAKGSSLNLTGFDFSISSDSDPVLTLSLRHADGTDVTLGPYDPAIAHFALAYAADGRPTTVTMVKADPLFDLKILLHPALVDTGLGCRAIRLDQFADKFGDASAEASSLRKQADEEARGLVALYRRAWADRYIAVTDKLQHKLDFDALKADHGRKVTEYNEIVDSLRSNSSRETLGILSERWRLLDPLPDESARLRRLARLRDEIEGLKQQAERSSLYTQLVERLRPLVEGTMESHSSSSIKAALQALHDDPIGALEPLRERPTYFESHLVGILEQCAVIQATPLDADSLSDCVDDSVTTSHELQRYEASEHFSWLAPPPKTVTWSGVREQPYNLDRELTFARPPIALKDGPLRFIVQIAIETPALLSKTDAPWYQLENEEVGSNLEAKPWEFENLQGALQDAVLRGVEENEEARSILRDMYEFTTVQRLFRAAFDGRLGIAFPVEQLARLAKETASYINSKQVRTLRWNARAGILSVFLAIDIKSDLDDWDPVYAKDFRDLVSDCLRVLDSDRMNEPATQSDCALTAAVQERYQVGGIPDPRILSKAEELEKRVKQLVATLQLRKALGVADDRKKSSSAAGSCPPP